MKVLIAAITLAVGSSLDNLSIGVLYGTRSQHFSRLQNLWIAGINAVGTFLAMAAGDQIARFLPPNVGPCLSAVLFLFLGFQVWASSNLVKNSQSSSYLP